MKDYIPMKMKFPSTCATCGTPLGTDQKAWGIKGINNKWNFLCDSCHAKRPVSQDVADEPDMSDLAAAAIPDIEALIEKAKQFESGAVINDDDIGDFLSAVDGLNERKGFGGQPAQSPSLDKLIGKKQEPGFHSLDQILKSAPFKIRWS